MHASNALNLPNSTQNKPRDLNQKALNPDPENPIPLNYGIDSIDLKF